MRRATGERRDGFGAGPGAGAGAGAATTNVPPPPPGIVPQPLDPASLLIPVDEMKRRAQQVLDQAGGRPGHIFNLGHGIMPQATMDQVRALVDYVHEASAR